MKENSSILIHLYLILFAGVEFLRNRKPVYKDPAAPIESRIKDLLGRMTLKKSVRQIDIWHPKMDLSKPEN